MHELSVCIAMLDAVERIAAKHAAPGVAKIILKIGPLSGIEADLLQHAYPLAAAGTLAADADLVIETDSIIVSCTQCGAESTARPNRLLCAQCGDFRTRVISGDEMILQTVELLPAAPPLQRATATFSPTH